MAINISAGTPSSHTGRAQIPPITARVKFFLAIAKLEPETAIIPRMTRAIPIPTSDQSTDSQ
jgi:hypothetical protein